MYSCITISNDIHLRMTSVTFIVLRGGRIDLCENFGKLLTDKAITVITLGLFINLSQLSQ